MCGWDACRRELCRRMCSPDEAERSIHIIAHRLLILEYLSLRLCRKAAYIRRQSVLKTMAMAKEVEYAWCHRCARWPPVRSRAGSQLDEEKKDVSETTDAREMIRSHF